RYPEGRCHADRQGAVVAAVDATCNFFVPAIDGAVAVYVHVQTDRGDGGIVAGPGCGQGQRIQLDVARVAGQAECQDDVAVTAGRHFAIGDGQQRQGHVDRHREATGITDDAVGRKVGVVRAAVLQRELQAAMADREAVDPG